MTDIGAEVGQKMRAAIKAKLTELECYVDDELPDYIMVMVANKRSKSQMKEDLQLFLNTRTPVFVDWLHVVLKKLKEVTVTNPEVYKKATKKKSSDMPDVKPKIKKEKKKKIKSEKKKIKSESKKKTLTDDLPFSAKRKITISSNSEKPVEDEFNIPLLSEVNNSNEAELQDIERKIKSVKSRLGIFVEDQEHFNLLKIKAEKEKDNLEKLVAEKNKEIQEEPAVARKVQIIDPETLTPTKEQTNNDEPKSCTPEGPALPPLLPTEDELEDFVEEEEPMTPPRKSEHTRIVFTEDDNIDKTPPRKRSVMDRLGKRPEEVSDFRNPKKIKIDFTDLKRNADERMWERSRTRRSPGRSRDRSQEERFRNRSRDFFNRSDSRDGNSRSRNRSRPREHFGKERERSRSRDIKHKNDRESDTSNRDKNKEKDLRDSLGNSHSKRENEGKVASRLGLMSKVSVPERPPEEPEEKFATREVSSIIQVKPRELPPTSKQANKNLLLKAVADAQRSVAQSKSVGKSELNDLKGNALYSKHFKEHRTLIESEKKKLRKIILENFAAEHKSDDEEDSKKSDSEEYVPKPVRRSSDFNCKYVPSGKSNDESENDSDSNNEKPRSNHKFIITLDGDIKRNVKSDHKDSVFSRNSDLKISKGSIKSRLEDRRTPSPIVFDKTADKKPKVITSRKLSSIPDELPKVTIPEILKIKEKCKYWPNCKNGEKCDFLHPSKTCEMFPYCKFGDKCVYIHPSCKFGPSCTRRDCPYSHGSQPLKSTRGIPLKVPKKLMPATLQTCKFSTNCSNINCSFYHPKQCKFGAFCKNKDCNFVHVPRKNDLTWRST